MKAFSRRRYRCSIGQAATWGAVVSAGSEKPELLNQLPDRPRDHGPCARTRRSVELGAIHDVLISLDSLPEAMGGSVNDARMHYARSVELSKGESASPHVSLASGISVAEQNRKEFENLLAKALAIDVTRCPACGCRTSFINEKRARFWRARTICSRQTSPGAANRDRGLTRTGLVGLSRVGSSAMRVLASLVAIGLLAAGYPRAQGVTQVRLGTVIPAVRSGTTSSRNRPRNGGD